MRPASSVRLPLLLVSSRLFLSVLCFVRFLHHHCRSLPPPPLSFLLLSRTDAYNDVYFNSNIDLDPKFSPMLTVPVQNHLGEVVAVMQIRTGDSGNFVSASATQILTLCTRQVSYVLGHHAALGEATKG